MVRSALALIGAIILFGSCVSELAIDKEGPSFDTIGTGRSYQGRPIFLKRLSTNRDLDQAILLVGGIHGGFESPSVHFVKWYKEEILDRSPRFDVYSIDCLSPDSLYREGDSEQDAIDKRFSAHGVDLNRNFPVNWQRDVTYREGVIRKFGGGIEPFSEPETKFLQKSINSLRARYKKLFVVMVHTLVFQEQAQGIVMPSYDDEHIKPEAMELANLFMHGSGFELRPKWTEYPVTGEFLAWAGRESIPAIDIELPRSRLSFEAIPASFEQAKKGLDAILY